MTSERTDGVTRRPVFESGAHQSFDDAFKELYPRALGVAYRILGNRAAAEDIAAETMAKAFVRWNKLDPDRRAGWIVKVSSNHAIDILRHKGHTMVPGVVDLEDRTMQRVQLAAAIAKLPKRQRQVVTLRYLSDLTEADTAEALGIGIGSVKTHTHRGLAALRTDLGAQVITDERGTADV